MNKNRIPLKLRKEMAADPYYSICARKGLHSHTCSGRITWEHAVIYAGKQIQEKWAIIPLCEYAHSVNHYQDDGDMDKDINVWIALNRATDEELMKVSKAVPYMRQRSVLNELYGVYKPYRSIVQPSAINY